MRKYLFAVQFRGHYHKFTTYEAAAEYVGRMFRIWGIVASIVKLG